jgi:phenylacetate-CoA ligase
VRHALRRLLIGAHYSARGNRTLQYLKEIERTQWLSRDELLALQTKKLKALLVHCRERIPYYARKFDEAGFDPEALRGPEDLRKLPVLGRDEIRGHATEMVDPVADTSQRVGNATGGSSGTPMRFYQDQTYREMKVAHIYRNFGWCGWQMGDRHAFIWGADVDSTEHVGLAGFARDGLYNVEYCNAFGIDDPGLDRFLDRLAGRPPAMLVGYASSLGELERRARETGRDVRIPAIVSSAEVLTEPLRARLRDSFRAQVFDRYGAREVATVAFECGAHTGLHTIDEANVVEIEPGTDGNVLVTNLNNRTMPLVRYRLGDSAALLDGPCGCGRGLGRMTPVRGRIGDYLIAPSGRRVHGEFFTHLFYASRGVRQFEVVQVSREDLIIRIVRGPEYEEAFRERLEQAIREHGDPTFRLRFEYPEVLQVVASGKRRFVRRELES